MNFKTTITIPEYSLDIFVDAENKEMALENIKNSLLHSKIFFDKELFLSPIRNCFEQLTIDMIKEDTK